MMKVFDINEDAYRFIIHNAILTYRTLPINDGEKVLFRFNDFIFGPFKLIETRFQKVVVATDQFNYYRARPGDELDFNKLSALFMPECYYTPITGNIFLDGFLSAAYEDEQGILRVNCMSDVPGLVDYISDRLEEACIEFVCGEDCFIISSEDIVVEIFDNIGDQMPVKFYLGYFLSFVVFATINRNTNPLPGRYTFRLFEGYLEDDAVPEDYFESSFKGSHYLYPIFGNFEPYSAIVNSIDQMTEDVEISNLDNIEDKIGIRDEVFPDLIKCLFKYAGYEPIIIGHIPYTLSVRKNIIEDAENRIKIAVIPNLQISYISGVDYVISIDEGQAKLHQVDHNKIVNWYPLTFCDQFKFGIEMSAYFEIIFKKL